MQEKWRLIKPEGVVAANRKCVNIHPKDLTGKTVVLYWNGKPNGERFLRRIGELLVETIKDVKVIRAWEATPSTKQSDSNQAASKATAMKLAGLKPDIVIGAPGDCAGTATWMVMDLLNLERLGIPTVGVITTPYLKMAETVPATQGYVDVCLVYVSPPIGMLSPADINAKAEASLDAILAAATIWQPAPITDVEPDVYPAEQIELSGTIEELNHAFLERQWSLGLPILPPLIERVTEMLRGTQRKPDELLGYVPPRMGALTVELAAVHATMAGCRPAYFPLLLAALEGLLNPAANWRLALTGSGTSQMIVVVNGPIIKKTGLGCGQGAAGKGHHANASIGYALNLIGYVVGGSRPPNMDRSTLGSPGDYVCWVFGENEDALPPAWNPFHVERGFQRSDSVVTVMASYPPVEIVDHWSATPEEHMRWWSRSVSPFQSMAGPSLPEMLDQNPLVALGPEHAQFIAAAGWSKDDLRQAIWRATQAPISLWPASCAREKLVEKYGPVSGESMIPITLRPDQIMLVAAGGDGKQSHYFPPYPAAFPISTLLNE